MISNHMGLVPLTDKINITRQAENPDVDEWGVAQYEKVSKEYKCHISYNYKQEAISYGSNSKGIGNTIVYTAKIYLRGLVLIENEDKIEFTDMCGNIVEKELITVYPVRDFIGKVLATCLVV